MNKEQIVNKLLDYFFKENNLHYKIPKNYKEKRFLLRGIINLREPYPISEEILKLEDNLLKLELKEKQITDSKSIKIIKNKMCIYLGDITTLKTEAIVNAANSSLLGCFIPNHNCIDNKICWS